MIKKIKRYTSSGENISKKVYYAVHVIAFLGIIFFFAHQIKNYNMGRDSVKVFLMCIGIGILVYTMKIIAFYLLLLGKNIIFSEHILQYAKTEMVNVIVPFKLGDIFRIYCYGYSVGSFKDSTFSVLTNGIIDFLAGVTIILVLVRQNILNPNIWIGIFLIIIGMVVLCYISVPRLYGYWNHFLIIGHASRKRIKALKYLELIYGAYKSINELIHGKLFLMYVIDVLGAAMYYKILILCKFQAAVFLMTNRASLMLLYFVGAVSSYIKRRKVH